MKTAIITGASKGIGAVIASRLNELGYNLVLNYRNNTASMDELISSFSNKETENVIVQCDISRYEDAKKLVDTAFEKFGSVDVLVNNAGITKDNLLPLMSEEEFDMVIDTNLKGTFNCCKHIAKRMLKQKNGRIINISSVVGLSGNAGQVNYSASKAGVLGMTKSIARELGKKNILVNAIAPGFIQTEMTDKIPDDIKTEMMKNIPLQRFGQPSDIADAVEFLISDKATYITGQVLSVNGGYYMYEEKMKRRVVITGIGVVSPIGSGAEFWEGIKKGKCGISQIDSFDTAEFSVKLAAEIKDFEPTDYIEKKESKRMDRYSQFAIAAADIAVKDSGIDTENIDSQKFGCVIGSAVGGIHTIEAEHEKLLTKGPGKVSTFFIPMMLSNMASGLVAIKYKAKNINYSTVTACATGANAIGESYKRIQDGICDVMLAGGSEAAITPCSIAGFHALTTLSTTIDVNRASIPFDQERHGFVMGEGAGVMVLEDYDHAIKRGAKIYAEVVGYGATCDAYHMTSPDPSSEGQSKSMQCAIDDAGIKPEQIGYINAHGTSTKYNDKFETQAIKNIFKDYANEVLISSTKSMTGHLLGAAGAVEAIVCAKSLQESFIPATINHLVTDPELGLNYVPNVGVEKEYDYALSNAFGFGGHNATLVLKKYKG